MRRLGLALILALAGCIGGAPEGLLREKGRVSSVALFDPARFGGDWRVLESGVAGCAGARQVWAYDGQGGYRLSGVDCAGGAPQTLAGQMRVTGPGARMAASGDAYRRLPVWVLWVDQDYRMAALGTPDGSFGMVLAREAAAGRDDLIRAAREVLDFNGYDLRKIGR